MLYEALSYLVTLGKSTANKAEIVGGRLYWSGTGNPIKEPRVSPVAEVRTLQALISSFEAPELKGFIEKGDVQIVVVRPNLVTVCSRAHDIWADRDRYIDAEWKGETFPFGRYLPVEEFIIRSQCMFLDSETKTKMMSYVSSVRGTTVRNSLDDGICQTLSIEDGLTGRQKDMDSTPIVELQAYRTFPEVEQPKSLFLLRMRESQGDKIPEAALFEADGGLWVSQASHNVASYIRESEIIKRVGVAVIG